MHFVRRERLKTLNAYADLDALAAKDRQTALDLVGDGCHALRALKLAQPP